MQVWINGSFYDQDKAVIQVTDRGFLLGDGFFETMRAHKGTIAWLPSHIERLGYHADVVNFPTDFLPSAEKVASIVQTLVTDVHTEDAVVRLTVSRGSGERGLLPPSSCRPTILITVAPFVPVDQNIGLRLCTSQKIRRNVWSVAGSIKSLNYLDNIAAKQEATGYGGDDALILSADGDVAETSVANIFVIQGDTLWTPHEGTGILCGIARGYVLKWAKESGVNVNFSSKQPGMLRDFDAVFTANALQGLRAVDKVDGEDVGVPANTLFTELARKVELSLCNGIIL